MAAKMKKDWSLVMWMFGWLLSFATAIKKVAGKLGMPFEAFEYLVSEKGEKTLERAMVIIQNDWRTSRSPDPTPELLPRDHYRIQVDRGPFPELSVLEEKIGRGISEIYDGAHDWISFTSRQGANALLDKEIVVYIHDFGPNPPAMTGEDVTDWALQHGYVPLDEQEVLAFALDPQTEAARQASPLVAYGSYVVNQGGWVVPVIENDPAEPAIKGAWFGSCIRPGDRYLFRKVK